MRIGGDLVGRAVFHRRVALIGIGANIADGHEFGNIGEGDIAPGVVGSIARTETEELRRVGEGIGGIGVTMDSSTSQSLKAVNSSSVG